MLKLLVLINTTQKRYSLSRTRAYTRLYFRFGSIHVSTIQDPKVFGQKLNWN